MELSSTHCCYKALLGSAPQGAARPRALRPQRACPGQGCRAGQGHGGGQRDSQRPAHTSAARQPWIHLSWEGSGGSAPSPPPGPSSSDCSEGRGSCHGWKESAHPQGRQEPAYPSLRVAGARTSHGRQAGGPSAGRGHTSTCPLIPAVTSRE